MVAEPSEPFQILHKDVRASRKLAVPTWHCLDNVERTREKKLEAAEEKHHWSWLNQTISRL